MSEETTIVTSHRTKLLLQSACIIFGSFILGWSLQSCDTLQTSPIGQLGTTMNLPLITLVIAAIGIVIAGTLLKDSWSHKIILYKNNLAIKNELGRFEIKYSDIEEVKYIPAFGVGIAMKDPEHWFTQIDASSCDVNKLRTISEVTNSAYGCDITILNKNLSVGSDAFIELLSKKRQIANGSHTHPA